MKTTVLVATVLFALGIAAQANTLSDADFGDAPANGQGGQARPATSEPASQSTATKKEEAKPASQTTTPATARQATPPATRGSGSTKASQTERSAIRGFVTNDGEQGTLEVGTVGDETVLKFTPDACRNQGGDCHKLVVFDKKTEVDMNDMKSLRDALEKAGGKKAERPQDTSLSPSERRRQTRTEERERNQITDREVREEIDLLLATECNIEEGTAGRRTMRDSRTPDISGRLSQTPFAGLQMPQRSADSNADDNFRTDAECATSVLRDFMDQYSSDDLEDLREKAQDLKRKEVELRAQLRRADEREKARIQKRLDDTRNEMAKANQELDSARKKASSYDRTVTNVARSIIIKPAVQDLATRQFFTGEDFFLHDLAATTPDAFKGVRRAASQSLLDIYRLQAQSYLAFNDLANKSQNPAEKLQFQQAAHHYFSAATNYNNMMNSVAFKGELGRSASQAGLNPVSILNEIYQGSYSQGAQQIQSYLTTAGTNRPGQGGVNQQIPQILMVQNQDGTYTTVEIGGTNNQGIGQGTGVIGGQGRGGRVAPVTVLNNTSSTQVNTGIQMVRPVQVLPNGQFNQGNNRLMGPQMNGQQMFNQPFMQNNQQFQPHSQNGFQPMNQGFQPQIYQGQTIMNQGMPAPQPIPVSRRRR